MNTKDCFEVKDFGKQIKGMNLDTLLRKLCNKTLKYSCYKEQILSLEPAHVALTLKVLRFSVNYSLTKLEKQTGFSKTSLSHRESKNLKSFPNIGTLIVYMEVYEITLSQFIEILFLIAKVSK